MELFLQAMQQMLRHVVWEFLEYFKCKVETESLPPGMELNFTPQYRRNFARYGKDLTDQYLYK